MDEPKVADTPPPPIGRKPYTTPVLREFGTVAAVTKTLSMDGQMKDGGPNNIKT